MYGSGAAYESTDKKVCSDEAHLNTAVNCVVLCSPIVSTIVMKPEPNPTNANGSNRSNYLVPNEVECHSILV